MKVYQAIAAVQADLAKEGISKDRKNLQQGYNFRGIDDVYAALAPVLSKHGLCFLPRVLTRSSEERQTQKGGTLFYVTVECEFDLVAAEDGSKHTVRTFGEAMDSADKATNKAMSAAYKYAAFQSFCIPCEGEDADATTHDVKTRTVTPQATTKPDDGPLASFGDGSGRWTGTNRSGRPFEGTGVPPPSGWFARVKNPETKAAAFEEIGGKFYGVEKGPAGWEIVRFIDPPVTREPGEDDPFATVPA